MVVVCLILSVETFQIPNQKSKISIKGITNIKQLTQIKQIYIERGWRKFYLGTEPSMREEVLKRGEVKLGFGTEGLDLDEIKFRVAAVLWMDLMNVVDLEAIPIAAIFSDSFFYCFLQFHQNLRKPSLWKLDMPVRVNRIN